ncbi:MULTISPECIES: helix-turn-helix domain-containing protein [Novosphingobium]|jgi:AraC-like DNA-binding protein|uniref:helix-turn-helix domain-containing protein n=1 Tax=Novosphingobium TaxID=165696 RepID=UPI000CCC9B27
MSVKRQVVVGSVENGRWEVVSARCLCGDVRVAGPTWSRPPASEATINQPLSGHHSRLSKCRKSIDEVHSAASLVEPGKEPLLVRRLKAAVLSGPRFDASEADIARELGFSARTLRRRLHALGTTYALTIAQVRFEFAKQCLADPMLTIGDVADRAGYTEVSNFRNAFKRWADCSPQTFRETLSTRGEDDALIRA